MTLTTVPYSKADLEEPALPEHLRGWAFAQPSQQTGANAQPLGRRNRLE